MLALGQVRLSVYARLPHEEELSLNIVQGDSKTLLWKAHIFLSLISLDGPAAAISSRLQTIAGIPALDQEH